MKLLKQSMAIILSVLILVSIAVIGVSAEENVWYYVTGESGLCGVEWDTIDENVMILNDSGLYEKTFEDVEAGQYRFRIYDTKDEYIGYPDDTDFSVTVTEKSNVTIIFDADTREISFLGDNVSATSKYDFKSMKVSGIFNEPIIMEEIESEVFSCTVKSLAPKSYQYSFKSDDYWMACWGNDSSGSLSGEAVWGTSANFHITESSEVIFTIDLSNFDYSTKKGATFEIIVTPDYEFHPIDGTDYLQYVIQEDGTAKITGYTGNAENLNIPSVIDEYNITCIGQSVFENCDTLKCITIPNSVKTIEEKAFYKCSNLKSLVIPDNVVSIGDYAFSDCTSLSKLTFNNDGSLTTIGKSAFSGCSKLSDITIPDSVKNLCDEAFYNCRAVTSLQIGSGITIINNSVFANCSSLTNITIPSSVNIIGKASFSGCSKLSNITIPDSVKNIGDEAFYNCRAVTSLQIGNGINIINYSVFANCSSLTSITIPVSVNIIGDYAFSGCSSLADVTIGTGVTSIGGSSFSKCASLTSITIPDSIQKIGYYAFSDCVKLSTVTISKNSSLTSIEDYAFRNCNSLLKRPDNIPDDCKVSVLAFDGCEFSHYECGKNITWNFDNGVLTISGTGSMYNYSNYDTKTLPKYINEYGSSITNVVIENGVTSIGDNAFYNCTNLKSITIPDSVSSLGYFAFSGCTDITTLMLSDNIKSIGAAAFFGCTSLKDIRIPNDLTKIEGDLFDGCISLEVITIPDSVVSIEGNAFYDCTNLTMVAISDKSKLTSIGEYAFKNCTSLNNILNSIPENCAIHSTAFDNCNKFGAFAKYLRWSYDSANNTLTIFGKGDMDFKGSGVPWRSEFQKTLKSVIIRDGVTSIGSGAFYDCTSLTNIEIPNSVTYIRESAFSNCSALKKITIPDSVNVIGERAFYYCPSLNVVTIGTGISRIEKNAFGSCANLTKVNISDLAAWCNISFEDSSANPLSNLYLNNELITNLTIPNGVESINSYAFCGCSSITSITIPESVTTINEEAFATCANLISVTVSDNVISIGTSAFSDCTNLETVTLSNDSNLSFIGDYAFYKCNNIINKPNIPVGCTVSPKAFYGCRFGEGTCGEKLTWSLENGVLTISGTGDMEYYAESTAPWMPSKSYIKDVVIENGVTSIGSYAFEQCSSIISATIPESVTSIGFKAFSSCESINNIIIPESVMKIDECAFSGCTSLTNITIPDSIANIGSGTFYGCTSLTNIEIPDSVTYIGETAFRNCYALKKLTIPDSVSNIGAAAFYDCKNLENIVLGNNVKAINDRAFVGCESLKKVTIPDNVTEIGDYAFGYYYNGQQINDYTKYNDFVIFCKKGTAAENYAVKNGIKYYYAYISECKISGIKAKTYNGKAQTQSITIKDGTKALKNGTDYTVSYKNNKNAGTATMTIKGKGSYTGSVTKTFKINKAANPMAVKVTAKTVKLADVKKKAQTVNAITVSKAQGKVSYKKTSGKSFFTVNSKTGKITIKKGTKKGTYKINVKISAAGNSNYNSKSVAKTVKITVK